MAMDKQRRFWFTLLFLSICQQIEAQLPVIYGDSMDAQQIIDIRAKLVEAENNIDLTSLYEADIFTDNAVMMPGSQFTVSKDSILITHEKLFDRWKGADMHFNIEIIYTMGRLAVEIGSYDGTVELKDGRVMKPRGKYLYTYQLGNDGRWRIHQMSWGRKFN